MVVGFECWHCRILSGAELERARKFNSKGRPDVNRLPDDFRHHGLLESNWATQ
jgi:hypothetical protein